MKKKKLPFLISDSISLGEIKGRRSIFRHTEISNLDFFENLSLRRLNFAKVLILIISVIFLGRLFQLTIFDGSKNRDFAENNRIRLVESEAARGKIFDRNGRVLAYSEERYFLSKDNNKSQISEEQKIELEKEGLAGENFTGSLGRITKEVVRLYPPGEIMSHVVGYTSEVQEDDIKNNAQLIGGEFVGRLGVEETYDQVLRGVNGKKIVEVDAQGKLISILGESASRDGQDILVTIDSDLQKKAYDAMSSALKKVNGKGGALIVTNPGNGEVLALLSFPVFDPTQVGKYVTRDDMPLFNRAIAGNYPPGSVFKIVSSFAGLESGKITKDTQIEDVGEFELGGVKFTNWFYTTYGGKDGLLKLDRAIARSNDIFFFRLGELVGLNEIKKWALALGFGQKTGIDLPGESFGLVPDETWKLANLGENWFLGDTMHLAIGQGFLVTTPLQINLMTDYVASGGRKVTPHLVSSVVSEGGKPIVVEQSKVEAPGVSSEYLDIVKTGMKEACQEKGTAWPFFTVTKYTIACKTGTAEKTQGNPHAWFTAYAPSDYPELAITVIIENGGEGSAVAAPIAKEILDWYFQRHK